MTPHEKASSLGGLLAGAYIVAGVIVYGALLDKHHAEQLQAIKKAERAKVAATQASLAQKEREVQTLQSTVDTAQEAVRASRSVGLLQIRPEAWQTFTATFYDGSGGINGDSITASGKRVTGDWTLAADTSILPMGSVVEVRYKDGTTKVYQVLDRGGAIHGHRVDIFVPDHKQALKLGRQTVQIRILLKGGK